MTSLNRTKFSITLELLKALAVLAVLVIGVLVAGKKALEAGNKVVLKSIATTRNKISFDLAQLLKFARLNLAGSLFSTVQRAKTEPISFTCLVTKRVRPTLAPPAFS